MADDSLQGVPAFMIPWVAHANRVKQAKTQAAMLNAVDPETYSKEVTDKMSPEELQGHVSAYGIKQTLAQIKSYGALEDERKAQAQYKLRDVNDEAVFRQIAPGYLSDYAATNAPAAAPAMDEDLAGYGTLPTSTRTAGAPFDPVKFMLHFAGSGGSAQGALKFAQALHALKYGQEGTDVPPEQVDIGGIPYVWKRGSREFNPRADYGVTARGESALAAIEARRAPKAPSGEPIYSKDGKLYWDEHLGAWQPVAGQNLQAIMADLLRSRLIGGTNAPAGTTLPAAGASTFQPNYKFVDGKLKRLNRDTGQYE